MLASLSFGSCVCLDLCSVADPLSVLWVLCQPFLAGELVFEKRSVRVQCCSGVPLNRLHHTAYISHGVPGLEK